MEKEKQAVNQTLTFNSLIGFLTDYIQSTNNRECLKWQLVRYLNPANHHRSRIKKIDKDYLKDLKLPFIIRDICKIEESY